MPAIIGALAAIGAFVILLLRRLRGTDEPGEAVDRDSTPPVAE